MRFFLMILLSAGMFVLPAKEWKPGKGPGTLGEWHTAWRLRCSSLPGGNLLLSEIGPDASVQCINADYVPHGKDILEVEYRASGGNYTNGQFYFRSAGEDFSDERVWTLPCLIPDGKWHTLKVSSGNIRNAAAWNKNKKITAFRLDLTDGPGGTIEISRIAIRPPQADRPEKNLEELLDAPVWPAVKTDFRGPDFNKVQTPYFSGKLICHPNDGRTPGRYFLRKTFALNTLPVYATLTVSADDAAKAFLNGKNILESKNWAVPDCRDVTAQLVKGENVLAFDYRNSDFAGGVLAELQMKMPDGSVQRVVTDGTFKGYDKYSEGWQTVSFSDAGWGKVKVLDPAPADPWTRVLPFRDIACSWKILSVRPKKNEYSAGESARIQIRIAGKIPDLPFCVEICPETAGGMSLPVRVVSVNESRIRRISDSVWTMQLEYRLPRWLKSTRMNFRIVTRREQDREAECSVQYIGTRSQDRLPENITSEVRMTESGPRLFMDGTERYPVIACVPVNSKPDPMDLEFRVVFPAGGQAWWKEDGKFNLECFDLAMEEAVTAYPKAKFFVQIPLYLPQSWADKHPEELSMTEDGQYGLSLYTETPHSFSSKNAMERMRTAVRTAVSYLENSPYRNRIIGYRIAGGITAEWIGWGYPGKRLMDYSHSAKEAFARFVSERFPDSGIAGIPSQARRLARSGSRSDLLDPVSQMDSIAYNYFYSESIADVIIDLCRTVKQITGNRKVVGTYYGYIFCLTLAEYPQNSGHSALHRLLQSGAVDFLMSPPSYAIRRFGYAMTDMKPYATIAKYGVLPMVENDPRTHTIPPLVHNYAQTLNPQMTVDWLERDFGITLCRLQPVLMYTYEGVYHSEFTFPEMRGLARKVRRTGEFMLKQNTRRKAEIALVVSEDSLNFCALENQFTFSGQYIQKYDSFTGKSVSWPEGTLRFTGPMLSGQLDQLSRCGAPFDCVLAEDLEKHLDDYKLYIFAGCLRYDERFLQAVQQLRRKKTTLLWLYAPGIFRDFDRNINHMQELTGFRFQMKDELPAEIYCGNGKFLGLENEMLRPGFHIPEQPGVKRLYNYTETSLCGYAERRDPDGALSIFSGAYRIPWKFYHELAERSGVHLFTPGGDPLDANESLVTLHARFPGRKIIRFPRKTDVYDIFHTRKIASDTDEVVLEAPLHSSWLLYWGADGEKLLKELKEDHE